MTKIVLSNSAGTRYMTRPSFINAVFWTGHNVDAVAKILGHKWLDWDKRNGLSIHTETGMQHVDEGCWVCIADHAVRPFQLTNQQFESQYRTAP